MNEKNDNMILKINKECGIGTSRIEYLMQW